MAGYRVVGSGIGRAQREGMISQTRPSRWRWSTWAWAAVVLVGGYALMTRPPRLGAHHIQVVPIPAPVVNLPPPPAVVVNVPPPPAPPPLPEPPPPPTPRATTPLVNVGCLFDPESASCRWDPGFPAISADGKRLAKLDYESDPNADLVAVSLVILDARSLRTLSMRSLLDGNGGEPPDLTSAATYTRTMRRGVRAQRLLDDDGYRSLVVLGSSDEEASPAVLAGVHAEFDGELVRAIDPATNRVLWQRRFASPAPKGVAPDDDCGGWGPNSTAAWWDPPTGLVLVSHIYRTGGCMCPDIEREFTWRAPRDRS